MERFINVTGKLYCYSFMFNSGNINGLYSTIFELHKKYPIGGTRLVDADLGMAPSFRPSISLVSPDDISQIFSRLEKYNRLS